MSGVCITTTCDFSLCPQATAKTVKPALQDSAEDSALGVEMTTSSPGEGTTGKVAEALVAHPNVCKTKRVRSWRGSRWCITASRQTRATVKATKTAAKMGNARAVVESYARKADPKKTALQTRRARLGALKLSARGGGGASEVEDANEDAKKLLEPYKESENLPDDLFENACFRTATELDLSSFVFLKTLPSSNHPTKLPESKKTVILLTFSLIMPLLLLHSYLTPNYKFYF